MSVDVTSISLCYDYAKNKILHDQCLSESIQYQNNDPSPFSLTEIYYAEFY